MEINPKLRWWRDELFDSVLESDWAATFTGWGVTWIHHPGSLTLGDGRRYEPDFLLPDMASGSGVLFEAKGAHGLRLDKPAQAATENGLDVIVGLVGEVPPDPELEQAGAVWCGAAGDPYVLALVNGDWEFILESDARPEYDVRHSADRVIQDPSLWGIRMFKAVGDSELR